MPFDIFTAAAIRDELETRALNARVDKVIQTSALAVALRLWSPGWSGWVLFSADARHPRVYATESKFSKGVETPPPFVMLLRKYCIGGRLNRLHQVHLDRILEVGILHHDHGQVTLVTELMGNRSNVILVDADGSILGSLKHVGRRQSRTRRIMPHERYQLPPNQPRRPEFGGGPKIDPLSQAERPSLVAALGQKPASMPLVEALVGLVQGCSPAIAREIEARVSPPADPQHMVNAVVEQYSILESREWSPIVICRDGRPVDFRAYSEPAVDGSEPAPSMSEAVEAVSDGMESTDALTAARARVLTAVGRRRTEVQSRLESLRRGLAAARDGERFRHAGDMVLGFQYQIEPGQETLQVDGLEGSISLDPDLSAVENAERYFKRYRKAREATKRLPPLIERAEADLALVEELGTFADLAETPGDLKRIEAELQARFGGEQPGGKKSRPNQPGRLLTVDLPDGGTATIGRSARQNEEVTFKVAGRSDYWLHARGVPGAHVAVRGLAEDADESSLAAAASLAAYYSKARAESYVDVIVARVRDVHRAPGGAPGQVTVRNGQTIRVPPRSVGDIEGPSTGG